jgi:hypothetical protein
MALRRYQRRHTPVKRAEIRAGMRSKQPRNLAAPRTFIPDKKMADVAADLRRAASDLRRVFTGVAVDRSGLKG